MRVPKTDARPHVTPSHVYPPHSIPSISRCEHSHSTRQHPCRLNDVFRKVTVARGALHCLALPCLAAHVHGQACIIRRLPCLVFGKPRGYYIWIVIEHSSMEVSLVNDHLRIRFEPLNTVSLKRYFEVYVNCGQMSTTPNYLDNLSLHLIRIFHDPA